MTNYDHRKVAYVFFAIILSFIISNTITYSQLVSPGELASVHSKLDGVQNCTKCHNFGDKTFRDQCLACHTEIKTRIDAKLGYHNSTRNIQCSACHKDHHGRDFKLIRWELSKFEHKQTSFFLEGKHSGLECKRCHNPSNIKMKDIVSKSQEAKSRTFLGLNKECGSCHKDMHRGQVSNNCGNCHTSTGWKPASNFSHEKAKFKLIGKHIGIACSKCHPSQTDGKSFYGESAYVQFAGLKFSQCIDCHKDHHNGAFGEKCDKCHSPIGWKSVHMSKESFNHSTTRYPLQGKHAVVQCEKCHKGGSWTDYKNKNFKECLTCHEDYHVGQLASRTDKGECSLCHTVNAYSPAMYEIKDHKNARFQLSGAHLAVPCGKCHIEIKINGKKTPQFHWDGFQCTQCHKDEHAGQFADKIAEGGCETCHSVQSWKELKFDHAQTRFKLDGKHLIIFCEKCHKTESIQNATTVRYKIDKFDCTDCHEDSHEGQFVDNVTKSTPCNKCHTTSSWTPTIFNHNTMSRFQLTGKHTQVGCVLCHKKGLASDNKMKMQFKPLDVSCSSCHKEFKN